jgi:uncharacterized protein (DUF697 family)
MSDQDYDDIIRKAAVAATEGELEMEATGDPFFLSGRRGAGKLQIVESKQSPAPKFLVVCNQQMVEAAAMLRQVGGSGSLVRDVKGGADKRADRIIWEMAAECAAAAWVPELSSLIQSGVVVVGVIRIARLYGVSLTRSEAGKFLKEALLAAGAYQAAGVVGEKVLTTVLEATGVLYFGAAAFDSAFTFAVAWALGTTAKVYFGHELGKGDLKRVARSSFRQARRQRRRKGRVKQPAEPGTTASPAYDEVSRILHSRVGREVLGQVALLDPSMARDMAKVLAREGITSFKDLSADALKAVDDETGLVRDLWSLTRTLVDTNALLRLALAPDTTYELLDTLVVLQDAVADVAFLSEVNVDIFQFPAGSPVAGAIYARHPISQQIFYPIAQFHRMSLEHKFSEAMHLLQALGAQKLRVHVVRGIRHEESVGAGLSVTKGGIGIGSLKGGLRMVRSSGGEVEFEAAYAEREPTLPEDLVWYPRESIWHQIVNDRLHHGLKSFELHVRYRDDLGIDAKLVQTLMGIPGHLELGGRYQEFEVTDWRISGSFMGPQ